MTLPLDPQMQESSQAHLIASEASRLQEGARQHVVGFLCRAWGETDLPEAALVRTREEIIAFIIAAQFGDTPMSDLHEENRQIIEEQIAAMDLDVASCDAQWQIDFEIGGISVERVTFLAAPGGIQVQEDAAFLAARLRRLFAHFDYPLPKFADDDARLIGIAGSGIGALLTRLETVKK